MNDDSMMFDDDPSVMFLVGAGVSIPVGIPAMREIYLDFVDKRKSKITESQSRTCSFLINTLKVEPDLEELLFVANAISEFDGSPLAVFVESSISSRPAPQMLRKHRSRLRERAQEIEDVERGILEYLAKTCFGFDRERAEEIFGDFIKAIAKEGYPVFSTNYDFVLEHVANSGNTKVNNNFIEKGQGHAQRSMWDYAVNFPTGDALTLIKLHGSVTWYQDDTGQIENIPYDTGTNQVGRDVTRLVVFPTRFKDIYDQHFFALYSHFLKVLSSASVIVITGHSLRDEYLRAGIIERFRKGDLDIVVVDPILPVALSEETDETPPARTGSIVHVPYQFEEFRDELSHLVRTSEAAEFADRSSEVARLFKKKSNKLAIRGNIRNLRAGEKKEFSVRVDARFLASEKPLTLRCWMESVGIQAPITRSKFLDDAKIVVEKGASGNVQAEIPLEISVPESKTWKEEGAVKLKVALLKPSVAAPNRIKEEEVVVAVERKYSYRSA